MGLPGTEGDRRAAHRVRPNSHCATIIADRSQCPHTWHKIKSLLPAGESLVPHRLHVHRGSGYCCVLAAR
jgi:hypothetical protein